MAFPGPLTGSRVNRPTPPSRGVFLQFARNYFIQRVRVGVVVVKVKAVVLNRAAARDTERKQWPDIGLGIFRCPKHHCTAGLQDLRSGNEHTRVVIAMAISM
jgi:hypothetical protein